MNRCPKCNIQCDPNIQYQCENCGELFWRSKELFEKNKKHKDYKQKIESPNYLPIKLDKSCDHKYIMSQLITHAYISLAEGNKKETIIYDFIKNGIAKEDAEIIINEANKSKKNMFRQNGRSEIISGIGLLALGGIITTISYSMTGPDGTYAVAGGAIVIGIITIIHGLYRSIAG